MVSVYTKGRYGNSTWQQMAAWVYAKKHGLNYSAPTESLAPNVWPTYHNHLQRVNWNASGEDIVEVNDGGHAYAELPFQENWRERLIMIGSKSIETGYFQSWKYLHGYEQQLKDAFLLSSKKIGAFDYGDGIIIHVRRGDYLTYNTKHPPVTEEYLLSAIHYIMSIYWHPFTDKPMFTFCSDDIGYCKEFVNGYFKGTENRFFFSQKNEEDEFKKMANCSYLITSNSSFSVLAGILNINAKCIVCPDERNYFGPDNSALETKDIMPSNWFRIKY